MTTKRSNKKREPNDQADLRQRLEEALIEIDRLRSENDRLKSVLESFSLRTAASLPSTSSKNDFSTSKASPEMPPTSPVAPPVTTQPKASSSGFLSSERKIQLFRSLFRGREDVHAVRWESKSGKSGYSPACANEWNPLLCNKPRSKCTNCKYIPISDEAIRDHLVGKKTIGLYPLLKDETCCFLAADFDKADWEDDSSAFLEACGDAGVPAYLERSRSGKGGHVWIFFEAPIPAALARRLGCAILTQAMEKRHQIGFESYDRFFPSQDRMPDRGFGNLISLPLQQFRILTLPSSKTQTETTRSLKTLSPAWPKGGVHSSSPNAFSI